MRVRHESAFILHTRNFSETSLVLDVFTPRHGRLGLLAKGARRPGNRARGVLKPFQPLLVSWSGRGELPILTGAEGDGAAAALQGEALYCGFYLNELLIRLLHRHDPHGSLYDYYRTAVFALGDESAIEAVLRVFERRLLADLGYGLVLDHDVSNKLPIGADTLYDYIPDQGPVRLRNPEFDRVHGVRVRGSTLLALAAESLEAPEALREAKRLMRVALGRHLGDKPLHSRRLFGPAGIGTASSPELEKAG